MGLNRQWPAQNGCKQQQYTDRAPEGNHIMTSENTISVLIMNLILCCSYVAITHFFLVLQQLMLLRVVQDKALSGGMQLHRKPLLQILTSGHRIKSAASILLGV